MPGKRDVFQFIKRNEATFYGDDSTSGRPTRITGVVFRGLKRTLSDLNPQSETPECSLSSMRKHNTANGEFLEFKHCKKLEKVVQAARLHGYVWPSGDQDKILVEITERSKVVGTRKRPGSDLSSGRPGPSGLPKDMNQWPHVTQVTTMGFQPSISQLASDGLQIGPLIEGVDQSPPHPQSGVVPQETDAYNSWMALGQMTQWDHVGSASAEWSANTLDHTPTLSAPALFHPGLAGGRSDAQFGQAQWTLAAAQAVVDASPSDAGNNDVDFGWGTELWRVFDEPQQYQPGSSEANPGGEPRITIVSNRPDFGGTQSQIATEPSRLVLPSRERRYAGPPGEDGLP